MPRKTPKKPVPYSPKVVTSIFERLADGESLRAICKEPGMPSDRAVRLWVLADEDLAAKYHQARNLGLDAMADEVIAIADGEDGTGDPIRDRLRFDARRWYLSKLAPRRYGDTLRHEVAGSIDLRAAIQAGQARAEARLRLSRGLTIDADSPADDAE